MHASVAHIEECAPPSRLSINDKKIAHSKKSSVEAKLTINHATNQCIHHRTCTQMGRWHRLTPLAGCPAHSDMNTSQHRGFSMHQRLHTLRDAHVLSIAHAHGHAAMPHAPWCARELPWCSHAKGSLHPGCFRKKSVIFPLPMRKIEVTEIYLFLLQ